MSSEIHSLKPQKSKGAMYIVFFIDYPVGENTQFQIKHGSFEVVFQSLVSGVLVSDQPNIVAVFKFVI